MNKALTIFIYIFISIFFIPINLVFSETINYNKPITVKLIPSVTFTAELNGAYFLENLSTGENILVSGKRLTFTYVSLDNVSLVIDGVAYHSTNGFKITEGQNSVDNFAVFSNILQVNEFKTMKYRGSFTIRPGKGYYELYNTLDIEDYLKGVIPNEMPAVWPMEALKAQTVAARNFAHTTMKKSPFLIDTSYHQVYRGILGEHSRTNIAIAETKGIYAMYNSQPIEAFFHSSSGGATENSENVWSGVVPYLRTVEDPFDFHPKNPNINWGPVTLTNTAISEKLFNNKDVKILSIDVLERTARNSVQKLGINYLDPTNREVKTLLLPDKTSANSLRNVFGIPLKSLQFNISSMLDSIKLKTSLTSDKINHLYGNKLLLADGSTVTIKEENVSIRQKDSVKIQPTIPTEFSFTGNGWGHRVGMSQYGALGMAEAGFSYDKILKHYYSGITVDVYQ